MTLFAATYQIGSMSDVNEEESALFMKEFEELVADIDAFGIFTHNLTIALPMFIPGFGIIWGHFSAWSTGFAFAVISSLHPIDIQPLAILFLSPFGIMELAAYALGTSRSFILIWSIIKKTNLSNMIKPTIIEIGVVTALLLTGGYIEFFMIEMISDDPLQIPELV